MSRFVRSSKYRHVFGKAAKKDLQYDNLKVTRSAWDTNKAACNNEFVAVCWEARGGGSFAVVHKDNTGKLPNDLPLYNGHTAAVLDIAFHPFNDSIIASTSEDATCKLWAVPEGGPKESTGESLQNLVGHRRKVGNVAFNPCADNICATTSTDYTLKLWDIESGENKITVEGHADIIQSTAWSWDGKLMVTSSKDKKGRIVDPRASKIVTEFPSHQGVKGSRSIWLGEKEKIFTVGFSRSSERQFSIWDPKNMDAPLTSQNIDTSSGMLMPFYDNDTTMVFLAGKGDGNIRYYEIVDDKPFIHYLTEYKSSTPQRGMAFYPKTACNVSECEVARALKVGGQSLEPISFIVPRKSDIFQDDIFPETRGHDAGVSASEWFGGKDGEPKKVSLQGGFVAPKRTAADLKVEKKEVDTGPQGEKELREAYEQAKTRVAYLEAELAKRDARIKELEG